MRVPGTLERDYRYQDIAFWNEYIPQLVNYMTTTFPPSEVSVRRELTVFKWLTGVVIVVLILFIVLTFSFAYQLYEKHYGIEDQVEDHKLVEYHRDVPSASSFEPTSRLSVL